MNGAVGEPCCPVCGATRLEARPYETTHLRVDAKRRVFRCADCTHCFLFPNYTAEEIAAQYGADYYAHWDATSGMAGEQDGAAAPHLRDRLARAATLTSGRRLLDVGCGKGGLLAHAAATGWDVLGIDVSADAVRRIRDELRLPAECGEIDTFNFPPGRFDVVHANHVIEHLPDPRGALRQFHDWLAPGGVIAIEVPNEFDNLFFALGRRLLPARRMVRAVPSPHVQFFTPRSLAGLIRRSGFEIVDRFTTRWQIGIGSRSAVRALKRVVARVERAVGRGGNIVALARRGR